MLIDASDFLWVIYEGKGVKKGKESLIGHDMIMISLAFPNK